AEQWVGPEFFNVLDTTPLYSEEPELLVWPSTDAAAIAAVPEVLQAWARLRDEPGNGLSWIGDALRESSLPDAIDETIIARWEAASRALDRRLPRVPEASGPMVAATRDAAALCAVLPASRLLARSAGDQPPAICRQLEEWGVACERLSVSDALVTVERAEFLRLLAEAGMGPPIWGGLGLALIHLWLPRAARLDWEPRDDLEPNLLHNEDEPRAWVNPWEDAKCFWYEVIGPTT
ncbi:MAG TPA: hypothetical protein VM782_06215, partial [Stellaceae bacterium]|nr:hypothetical protein [Stellaceae bacterium]